MDLHHVKSDLIQLEDVAAKLEEVSNVQCPVVKDLSLQYDYFLKFVGLYEDIEKKLNSITITHENELEVSRLKRELEKHWKHHANN